MKKVESSTKLEPMGDALFEALTDEEAAMVSGGLKGTIVRTYNSAKEYIGQDLIEG
jgi:hypothetical protein